MTELFLLVRGSRPGKTVQLTEGEIRGLCLKSREIFLSQPILLELEAPLKICGKFYIINVFLQGFSNFFSACTKTLCMPIEICVHAVHHSKNK